MLLFVCLVFLLWFGNKFFVVFVFFCYWSRSCVYLLISNWVIESMWTRLIIAAVPDGPSLLRRIVKWSVSLIDVVESVDVVDAGEFLIRRSCWNSFRRTWGRRVGRAVVALVDEGNVIVELVILLRPRWRSWTSVRQLVDSGQVNGQWCNDYLTRYRVRCWQSLYLILPRTMLTIARLDLRRWSLSYWLNWLALSCLWVLAQGTIQ